MSNVPRSLDSLLAELAEIDRQRRRLLDAIAEHPDTPIGEHPLQTVARRSSARIEASLASIDATAARCAGRRHLRDVADRSDEEATPGGAAVITFPGVRSGG